MVETRTKPYSPSPIVSHAATHEHGHAATHEHDAPPVAPSRSRQRDQASPSPAPRPQPARLRRPLPSPIHAPPVAAAPAQAACADAAAPFHGRAVGARHRIASSPPAYRGPAAPVPHFHCPSIPPPTPLLSTVVAGEATGGREELILLGFWTSPFVMRARFVLNLKGLPYEYVEEDLFNNKSQLLLASNPVHKKVPVLIHNGKPVCESMVIVQYIDEAFPSSCPRVLPSNPHERAAARFWAANVDDKLFSTWIPVYNGRTVDDRVEAARQLIAVLQMFEQAFRECSNGKAFFGGDSVGLVDVVLGSFLGWLNASEAMCGVKVIDADKTPLLAAWAERFGALDGVKEVMPDTQRLVEYNMMRRACHGLPLLLPHQ